MAIKVSASRGYSPTGAPPVGGGTIMGWNKTAANTGLASKGVTDANLTAMTVPGWGFPAGGGGGNISGSHTRRRFSDIVAPAANSTFVECLFEGAGANLVVPCGANVQFIDCEFRFTGVANYERTALNGHPYYGAGGGLIVRNGYFTGGTIFINITDVPGSTTVEDCYGTAQDPDNNGGQQHRDGITIRGGDGPTYIRRSRFDCGEGGTTGALFIQDTYGNGISNVTVEDSMFEGSGYCMTVENGSGFVFRNNRARPYGSHSFGAFTRSSGKPGATYTTWENNYLWADNALNEYKGSAFLPS